MHRSKTCSRMSSKAASVLAKSFRLTSHVIMTLNTDLLRKMQARCATTQLSYIIIKLMATLKNKKALDFLLGVVTLRNKQYITSNCGTYCSFTANLLPLKMSVVLPEIYILSWDTFFLLLCVCFFSPAELQLKEKPLRRLEERLPMLSVVRVFKRGLPCVTQHPRTSSS